MKYLITILFASTLTAQNLYENDSIIIWNKSRKLQWDDFKKLKDEQRIVYNNIQEFANCSMKIGMYPEYINCDDLDQVMIFVKFKKFDSWKFEKMLKSKYITYDTKKLLSHEQLHFDISELYARKIRHLVNQNIDDCDFELFKTEYYKLLQALINTQDEYDRETRHGLDSIKQKEWGVKVDSLLTVYKDYERVITLKDIGIE